MSKTCKICHRPAIKLHLEDVTIDNICKACMASFFGVFEELKKHGKADVTMTATDKTHYPHLPQHLN